MLIRGKDVAEAEQKQEPARDEEEEKEEQVVVSAPALPARNYGLEYVSITSRVVEMRQQGGGHLWEFPLSTAP